MSESIKNNIGYIGKGILISSIFTCIALIVLSLVLTYSNVSENIETSGIIVINIVSILLGSSFCTLKEKNKGMLKGLAVGGIYIGIIYIVSSIMSMKFALNINSIIMIFTSLVAGATGGIIGINVKK